MKRRKALIADLPSGVNVLKTVNGNGREFWRVRLGKRFTGGEIVKRDFANLGEARDWIFGGETPRPSEAMEQRAAPQGVIDLRKKAGSAAFELSSAQIQEATWAFRALDGASLTDAVRYYLAHAGPKSL